jgi:membrane dipeptidase
MIAQEHARPGQDDRARELHRRAVVIDAACPLVNPKEINRYLPALRCGGVTCAFATVAAIEGARETLYALAAWYARFRELGENILLALTAEDIVRAKATGSVAVVFHFQGGTPLEYDPRLVEAFYRLGVRVIQITYNERNPLGDGCTERTDGGLSKLGLDVIAEMNRLRILVDLTHVGYRTSMEAIEASGAPVIFSHSNARALCDSPRNLPDELLRAVAAHHGVVGVCAFPAFVSTGSPTVRNLLAHIDYLCRLIGPEHVGLGLDFSTETEEDYEYFRYDPKVYPRPPWTYPADISGFAEIPNVTRGLVELGYSDQHILNIMGGNFLRVFRQVCG